MDLHYKIKTMLYNISYAGEESLTYCFMTRELVTKFVTIVL